MKLHASIYISPNPQQGTFTDVFIEETETSRKRENKLYKIVFEMYYFKDNQRIVLSTLTKIYKGNHTDKDNTNRTGWVDVPNPDFDPDFEEIETTTPEEYTQKTTGFFRKKLTEVAIEQAKLTGVISLPKGTVIVDIGEANYENLPNYMTGDTFGSEEIILKNEIAEVYFLQQEMNGEKIINQFQFVKLKTQKK